MKIVNIVVILSLFVSFSSLAYDFHKAKSEKVPGLWWFRQDDGRLFDNSKPIIVFIHGASGIQYENNEWDVSKYVNSGWNVSFFNWANDFNNTPVGALNGPKSSELANNIINIIQDENFNNNEIRFVGYSWGIFPASYAAKKVLSFVKNNNKKILVTIDAVEPVPYWGGYIKDDEGNTRWGVNHVIAYMQWVASNQVVSILPGEKLFKAVYCYWSKSDAFTRYVKPIIKDNLKDKWYGTWHYKKDLLFTQNHIPAYRLYLKDTLTTMNLTRCRYDHRIEEGMWIRVQGGSFDMGSNKGINNEQPVHSVRVPTFEILKTEVTMSQYFKCVEDGVCTDPINKDENYYCNWGYSDREYYPINCVDWFQAREYCDWIGGRLPTASEWEYAARDGGKDQEYPWGDETPTCEYAVMEEGGRGCGEARTWPVCSKPKGNTSVGICDMSGNVYEWVEDEYHRNYDDAPADGSAWSTEISISDPNVYRVVRGGSWYDGGPTTLRAAYRWWYYADLRRNMVGIRCTRDAK